MSTERNLIRLLHCIVLQYKTDEFKMEEEEYGREGMHK